MMRASNTLISFINFSTFLLSIPILAGGIWLSVQASRTDCMRFLQWPLIIVGVVFMVISLIGFAGSCYQITWLLWLYLLAVFLVIGALFGFIVFAFAVTAKGSGRPLLNRAYQDYYLSDYSGWLKDRVSDRSNWVKISSCVRDVKVCRKMGSPLPESPDMFNVRRLSPIESGCCKPPTECGYTYINETVWTQGGGMIATNLDCSRWSNDQDQLCYSCDSCKAGVLASLKRSWKKVSIINIVALVILLVLFIIGVAAFRNSKRIDNNEPMGESRMAKAKPSTLHF